MFVGYARVSTAGQDAGFEAQLRDLNAAGCERVFQERVSSVASRAGLTSALDFVRQGDVFIVTKLDRLARSVADLMSIVDRLQRQGVELRVLAMNLDTGTPTGKLLLGILGSVAQFEREIMLERQREGIVAAKAAGRYKGRAPTARAKAGEVRRLHTEGVGCADIARQLGIGRASVYRLLGAV